MPVAFNRSPSVVSCTGKKRTMRIGSPFSGVILIILAMCLAACGERETLTFEAERSFTFEGPLFEGPESAQASLAEAFNAFLNENAIERSQIKAVQLVEAEVTRDDAYPLDLVTDAGLTFAGSGMDMTQVAVLNPVPSDNASFKLNVSAEAKAAPFFKADDFILLLDLGFGDDVDDDYRATARMRFEVTIKK